MTLNEYINGLTEILKNNPESGEMEVIYSVDDEGNNYAKVFYTPTIGNYESSEFLGKDQYDEWFESKDDYPKTNAVCIN